MRNKLPDTSIRSIKRYQNKNRIIKLKMLTISSKLSTFCFVSEEKIPPEFFLKELEVIEKAASKHVNNHVAWNLASYLLTHVKSATILQDFWRISHKWVSINVSDFSGMHFHQRVLIRLIETSDQLDEDFKSSIASSSENYLNNFFSSKNTKDDFLGVFFAIHLVSSEFELNDSLINFYGSHESLWAQRRFLSYLLVKQLPEIVSEENMKLFFHITDESPANNNVVSYLQMINASCFKNVTDCKLFIERYNHWMKHLEIYPADIWILVYTSLKLPSQLL